MTKIKAYTWIWKHCCIYRACWEPVSCTLQLWLEGDEEVVLFLISRQDVICNLSLQGWALVHISIWWQLKICKTYLLIKGNLSMRNYLKNMEVISWQVNMVGKLTMKCTHSRDIYMHLWLFQLNLRVTLSDWTRDSGCLCTDTDFMMTDVEFFRHRRCTWYITHTSIS